MLRLLGIILSGFGLGISSYLSHAKYTSSDYVCGISSCGVVNNSVYSYVFGVPVAYLGLLFYIVMLFLLLVRKYTVLVVWSSAGLLFSLYLTYLEAFVIHAWCQWCVFSAWISLGLFIVTIKMYMNYSKIMKIDEDKKLMNDGGDGNRASDGLIDNKITGNTNTNTNTDTNDAN